MKTCCFIGHRKIDRTEKLSVYTKRIIEKLLEENVTTFLFGSRSQFDDLCLETATALKEKYPHLQHLKRIFVRRN